MKTKLRAFSVLAIACILTATVHAALIISPGANATTSGDRANGYPFDIGAGNSMRYQQVFAAAEFAPTFAGVPQNISQLRFRPDQIGTSFSPTTLSDVEIRLSTTNQSASSLNSTFANNVGADDLQVFNGSLTLASGGTGTGTPDFDIVIDLATPFPYNPALGNLLMDVQNRGGGSLNTAFDGVDNLGTAGSRLVSALNGVNDATGLADSGGLITQFQISPVGSPLPVPVPEPSQWGAAFAVGLLGVGFLRRRRAKAV